MVDAVRVGSAVGVDDGGAGNVCARLLEDSRSTSPGRQVWEASWREMGLESGELHHFLLLVLLDRFDRLADFGFVWNGALVETAKSLAQAF